LQPVRPGAEPRWTQRLLVVALLSAELAADWGLDEEEVAVRILGQLPATSDGADADARVRFATQQFAWHER
jgi:hypothetical protein